MRIYDLITKKRNGAKLGKEEIDFFVQAFSKGDIADYQASAFLMAVFLRGMDAKETTLLTRAMTNSGQTLDLSAVRGIKVDKHSTGGVGDGISIVVAPLVASLGVPVPMISGRGLGHTGGTLDKLVSIPGFRVDLRQEQFIEQLKKIGVSLIGQTEEIAPADKKLYALRDVTATVESIPLIASSILSKKFAEGCDALVLDVKVGRGAFMQERNQARDLARLMVQIGKRSGVKIVALITNMDQPLGKAVGNSLEVEQAVQILRGKEEKGLEDFIELTDILGGWMLFLGGVSRNSSAGKEKMREARRSGAGLSKFREIVESQGGDTDVCRSPETVLPQSAHRKPVLSPWKGIVTEMNARSVGMASLLLGAGRQKKEDPVDWSAGILLYKKTGDRVERGEALAEFRASHPARFEPAEKMFLSGVKISKVKPKTFQLVDEVIR